MESRLSLSLIFIFMTFVASHASINPQAYFKSVLPNTPLPKVIQDSLSNAEGRTSFVLGKPKENFPGYDDAASDQQIMAMRTSALFFLEKDMHAGKSVNLHISKDTTTTPPFVPRQVADSLPISSNKLQDIYKTFKVNPDSIEGKLIKKTVNECEKASNQGQDQYCATSLESMVDFVTSKIGKRIKAVSTQVDGQEITPLQGYRVEEVKKLNGDNVVVCHQEYYAYAIHNCHKAPKINAYSISLVGENNVKANAISICHEDTASWNPKHLAFQVLNVKPGTEAVCHFLPEDEVAWVPY